MARAALLPDEGVRLRQAEGMPVMFKSSSTSLTLLGIRAVAAGILPLPNLRNAA